MQSDKKKRKRTSNTSREQYEVYLDFIENDHILRNNTLNPSIGGEYVNDKWDELARTLNGIGGGPHLSAEEWKKRFNDWKNSTRSKVRKLSEARVRPSAGKQEKIKLTDLEERGLAVWGTVASGSKVSPENSGPSTSNNNLLDLGEENHCKVEIENVNYNNMYTGLPELNDVRLPCRKVSENGNCDDVCSSTPEIKTITSPKPSHRKEKRTRSNNEVGKLSRLPNEVVKPIRPPSELEDKFEKRNNKAISAATDLTETLKNMLEKYSLIEEKKLELERKKLEFEIAKFKYQNRDFDFDM